MSHDDVKIDALEHDNTGSDESFSPNTVRESGDRDMLGMHEEELGDDFVDEKKKIKSGEEEGLEKAGFGVVEGPKEIPVEEEIEEGFGLDDTEPEGTAEYDTVDEWN